MRFSSDDSTENGNCQLTNCQDTAVGTTDAEGRISVPIEYPVEVDPGVDEEVNSILAAEEELERQLERARAILMPGRRE
jgi:hypothetical protein